MTSNLFVSPATRYASIWHRVRLLDLGAVAQCGKDLTIKAVGKELWRQTAAAATHHLTVVPPASILRFGVGPARRRRSLPAARAIVHNDGLLQHGQHLADLVGNVIGMFLRGPSRIGTGPQHG